MYQELMEVNVDIHSQNFIKFCLSFLAHGISDSFSLSDRHLEGRSSVSFGPGTDVKRPQEPPHPRAPHQSPTET